MVLFVCFGLIPWLVLKYFILCGPHPLILLSVSLVKARLVGEFLSLGQVHTPWELPRHGDSSVGTRPLCLRVHLLSLKAETSYCKFPLLQRSPGLAGTTTWAFQRLASAGKRLPAHLSLLQCNGDEAQIPRQKDLSQLLNSHTELG